MSDTAVPQIGDTRPAPEDIDPEPYTEQDPDAEQDRPALRQLREAYERVQARNAKLEPLAEENAALKRQLGLVSAGVDPDSMLWQTVATAAAADGVSDPEQVAALARTLRAEMNGGAGRPKEDS
jgi:hypothetical protein